MTVVKHKRGSLMLKLSNCNLSQYSVSKYLSKINFARKKTLLNKNLWASKYKIQCRAGRLMSISNDKIYFLEEIGMNLY